MLQTALDSKFSKFYFKIYIFNIYYIIIFIKILNLLEKWPIEKHLDFLYLEQNNIITTTFLNTSNFEITKNIAVTQVEVSKRQQI